MKKTVFSLVLLMVLLIPSTVMAWDDCPRGKVCTYPGKCSRYIDTNGDGICDHGQEEPVALTTAEDDTDIIQAGKIQSTKIDTTNIGDEKITQANILTASSSGNGHREIYHLTQITIILTMIYAITHIMVRKGIIRLTTHRKFWNMALLASFLVSLILGLILIININFGTQISLPFDILLWHVEAGIAMGVISVFHIIWHWNYFKKMVKSLTATA